MSVYRLLPLLGLLAAPPAVAGPEGERLRQALPAGYKVAFSQRQERSAITEMIPRSESPGRWSEMLTTQAFPGGQADATPESFFRRITAYWKQLCPRSEARLLQRGEENGYPFALWQTACPLNKATGRPEYTWFKAVQGRDSFYLVQKAWRRRPTPDDVQHWTRYLQSVDVCDPRLAGGACAAGRAPARLAGAACLGFETDAAMAECAGDYR